MEDGRLRGVEALVRWNHPQFGVLTPNRFIGLAEEDGSIVPLGRWVLRHGLPAGPPLAAGPPGRAADLRQRQRGRPSGLGLGPGRGRGRDPRPRPGLAPHLLQLELTESAVMGSAGRPLQALQALSDMGVRIAIDDFGTGYSNLAYLSRLPVSVLKLDGSFVRGFQYDDRDAAARAEPRRRGRRRGDDPARPPARADRHRRVRGDLGAGDPAAAHRLRHRTGLAVLASGVAGSHLRAAGRRRTFRRASATRRRRR